MMNMAVGLRQKMKARLSRSRIKYSAHDHLLWVFLSLLVSTLSMQTAIPEALPVEQHDRILLNRQHDRSVALTLDACSGQYDAELIEFLITQRIPATIFVTRKWLLANPKGAGILKSNLDLFEIEDHGENHIPAVIGPGRRVYGILGEPDILHLRREVQGGADAISQYFGVAPHWYRGATAEYDQQASDEIRRMGYQIAGFSVNADAGATLTQPEIEKRMRHVQPGDIIIAHMNKPRGATAEGLKPGILELLFRGFEFVRLDKVSLQPSR
jgi:peptidoglycan/xylan/chitin deacetylase (PgdA/CDA1 family)